MAGIKEEVKFTLKGIMRSYSQVFFSDHLFFAVILLLVSFIDLYSGIAGLIAVVTTCAAGALIGFDRNQMAAGTYGFNSFLVGISIGIWFKPALLLYIIIVLASILTLFISVSVKGILTKYGLPFLSIPFLFGAWVLTLASRELSFLGISERGIYTLNEMYILGGSSMVDLYEWWNRLEFVRPVKIYLQSLGAILFQYNTFAGILIAAGLLASSRIAFTLSLLGFFTAYYFYQFAGAEISDLNYSYIGFNYILTSVAVGGFFLVPSARSYIWTVVLVPIVALITISLSSAFSIFYLPIYALPFNIVVLLFLYVVKFRTGDTKSLAEVVFQQNSPERNLYAWVNDQSRFRHEIMPLRFPFFGTWSVSQGHEGVHTHKGEWRHAWDFIIKDKDGKQHRGKGDIPEDYYCYGKPVTAAADGIVEMITDDVADNIIGESNVKENWGNTVVIRHTDYLFTSVSHLRPGSITVKKGERVKSGDVIGKCGNSGRSPYPHLHFQVQGSPYIGAPTLSYRIANYIRHTDDGPHLATYGIPDENELVSNVETNNLLKHAFRFIPGRDICWKPVGGGQEVKWEVATSEYNYQYIRCKETGAIAWFRFDESMFYFTHFTGSKSSLLFQFYMAAYKVPLGYYKGFEITDILPVNMVFRGPLLWLHDFTAPFVMYLKPLFRFRFADHAPTLETQEVKLKTGVTRKLFKKILSERRFEIALDEKGVSLFKIMDIKGVKEFVRCEL
jgi:urea transporter